MYDGELMGMYQAMDYYDNEIICISKIIDWSKLNGDQLNRLLECSMKRKELFQQILHEQQTP